MNSSFWKNITYAHLISNYYCPSTTTTQGCIALDSVVTAISNVLQPRNIGDVVYLLLVLLSDMVSYVVVLIDAVVVVIVVVVYCQVLVGADGKILRITDVASEELLVEHKPERVVDCAGKVIFPGFVDPHTHVVFSGVRDNTTLHHMGDELC